MQSLVDEHLSPRSGGLFDDLVVSRVAAGSPVILEVADGAEPVGYMVVAAEEFDASIAAHMIDLTDGFLCVAMEDGDLDRLGLPPMSDLNEAADGVDYAVSVDAVKGVTTGISAYDRARTIRALADADTVADDLARPGHVLPVRAGTWGDGPRGIAAASLALMRQAGMRSVAVFAPLLSEAGEIADHDELVLLAERFDLALASSVEWGREAKPTACENTDGRTTFRTARGQFRSYEYRSPVDGLPRIAVTRVRDNVIAPDQPEPPSDSF